MCAIATGLRVILIQPREYANSKSAWPRNGFIKRNVRLADVNGIKEYPILSASGVILWNSTIISARVPEIVSHAEN